jgi:hypothetical protein
MIKKLNPPKIISIVLTAVILFSCLGSLANFTEAQTETLGTQPRGSAEVIADLVSNVSTSAGWNSTPQTIYDGIALGKTTVAQLQKAVDAINVDSASDAETVFYWYLQLSKFGVGINDTTIKAALNAMPMLPNIGGLPYNYQNDGVASFLVSNRFVLYAYQWAVELNYQTAKWNLTKAYTTFNNTVASYQKPLLCVGSDGEGWGIDYGPRYYDECAQTIDMYLTFYLLGISDGLKQAQYWWNWENDNLWAFTETGEGYYQYALDNQDFECEAGSFDMLIWRLYAHDQSTPHITNLFTDIETRALSQNWSSPQWADYVVVHTTGNYQQRLGNTIISWASMMGLYGNMTATMQAQVQMLLNGTAADEPAWSLTMRSELYDNTTGLFRMRSDWDGPANEATADAAVLLMLLSTVPETGALAVPLQDYQYQDLNGIIDGGFFNVTLAARKVTISVSNPGTFLSMFGTHIFQYSIESPGIWQLTFSEDWNSLTAKTLLSELPNTRLYLGAANYTEIYAMSDQQCTISPAGFVNVENFENLTFTYSGNEVEVKEVLVDNQPVAITGSYTFTNLTTPHTIAVTSPLSSQTNPQEPTSTPAPTPASTPNPTFSPPEINPEATPAPTKISSPPAPTPSPNASVQPTPTADAARKPTGDSSAIVLAAITMGALVIGLLAFFTMFVGGRKRKQVN